MIEKFKAATASKVSGNFITPAGRIVYPALFKPSLPRGETDQDKARYQVTLLIPKDSNLDVLKKAVEDVIDENVSAKAKATTKVKKPWLKTEDQPRFAEYAEDYPYLIRMNAKMRPDTVSPSGQPVREDQEADEVYSGRWARVSVRPFFYDHPTGGKGVSFGLQNCQLLDHDEPIAGGRVKGTAEFEGVGGDDLGDLE